MEKKFMVTSFDDLVKDLTSEELDELLTKVQEEKIKKLNYKKVYYFYGTARVTIAVQANSYNEAQEKFDNWQENHSDADIIMGFSDGFDFNEWDSEEVDIVKYPPDII